MTPEPRFLALVAKVDKLGGPNGGQGQSYDPDLHRLRRALKVAIMAHEPDEDGNCKSCSWGINEPTDQSYFAPFPCKPFLDIESEVGK